MTIRKSQKHLQGTDYMFRISCEFGQGSQGRALYMAQSENRKAEDSVLEMLAWLFVKSDEEILDEAEIALLNSMFLAEDPRAEARS
jgi:hypothetical protein